MCDKIVARKQQKLAKELEASINSESKFRHEKLDGVLEGNRKLSPELSDRELLFLFA